MIYVDIFFSGHILLLDHELLLSQTETFWSLISTPFDLSSPLQSERSCVIIFFQKKSGFSVLDIPCFSRMIFPRDDLTSGMDCCRVSTVHNLLGDFESSVAGSATGLLCFIIELLLF